MAAAPVKLFVNNPTQTSLNVWWQATSPLPSGATLQLEVRAFPGGWDAARVLPIPDAAAGSFVVRELIPTSAYEFRMCALGADGSKSAYSNVAPGDTLPVGCTGNEGDNKKKCVIV